MKLIELEQFFSSLKHHLEAETDMFQGGLEAKPAASSVVNIIPSFPIDVHERPSPEWDLKLSKRT